MESELHLWRLSGARRRGDGAGLGIRGRARGEALSSGLAQIEGASRENGLGRGADGTARSWRRRRGSSGLGDAGLEEGGVGRCGSGSWAGGDGSGGSSHGPGGGTRGSRAGRSRTGRSRTGRTRCGGGRTRKSRCSRCGRLGWRNLDSGGIREAQRLELNGSSGVDILALGVVEGGEGSGPGTFSRGGASTWDRRGSKGPGGRGPGGGEPGSWPSGRLRRGGRSAGGGCSGVGNAHLSLPTDVLA